MENTNVIAWLLPSSTNQPALGAIRMPQNTTRRVDTIPSSYNPIIQTPNPNTTPSTPTIDPSVLTKTSPSLSKLRPALELSFTNPPKNHLGFVLGTDPDVCDVVLPSLPGISPVHCHITFDAEQRLILRDTSETGTAVWYDGNSNGDRRRESWALSSGCTYGFPSMVDRVVIDVQTVRFQVLVNEAHLLRPEVYQENVNNFMSSLASGSSVMEKSLPTIVERDEDLCDFYYNFDFDLGFDLSYDYDYDFDFDMSDDDDGDRMDFLPPIPSVVPPVYVKYLLSSDDGMPPETYLWNTTRPWEPMVKVAC
ncbi:CAMK family protein kinase [Colletotrichum incanum]|nr:CAMK family protein kinase [Colletotrichum incanum]